MSKIDELKKKKEQLAAQIKALEAKEKSEEKKKDTRRKILIGAMTQDKAMTQGKEKELIQDLDSYLKKNRDRALFDLPLLEENT